MSAISLDIQAIGLGAIIEELRATEKQVDRALASTMGKMSSWLRTRSVRGLSDELAVAQKIIRRRLKTFRVQRTASGQSITIWYGLDPVALIHLGARQTKRGVTAGKHRRDGAFIATGPKGGRQVFKRRGAERLPIGKQSLDVQDKAQTFLEDSIMGAAEFEARFFKTFEHELKWRTRTQ